ncbi:MAG TPA: hypothetical protein VFY45_08850 [Baekduia sp.]|nr:hypothetical protein [Baekduia sp.]
MTLNENSPWMTLFACMLAVLFTIVGGIVAIVHVQSLTFEEYLDDTGKAAVAIATLGVGRSLKKGLARGAGGDISGSWLERAPVSTITVGLMVLIAGVAGGILTIADPGKLDFHQYLDQMTTFAFAVGIQGAGRAVRKGIEVRGAAQGTNVSSAAAIAAGAAGALGAGGAQTGAVDGGAPDSGPGGANGAAAGIENHPDYAGATGGMLAPENLPAADDLSFVDPADLASLDDDLGADEEPTDEADDNDLSTSDLDESDLPSDEEEEAHPPPDDLLGFDIPDAHELERTDVASEPNAVMPSQEEQQP